MKTIFDVLASEAGIAQLLQQREHLGTLDVSVPTGIRPSLLAMLVKGSPTVVITATGREADEVAAALRLRLHEDAVAVFPSWETLPHERLSPRCDTVAARLSVLRRLVHPDPHHRQLGPLDVLVVPVRSFLQPIAAGLADLESIQLSCGDTIDLETLQTKLVAAAYTRVDMVERRGEFAVRGGIIDIFPPTNSHPVRCELWGDEVNELREFAVADQRSLGPIQFINVPPCRELVLSDAVRERACELIPVLPGLRDMLDKIAAGMAAEGMESLAPALVDQHPLLDLFSPDTLILVCDPERVRRRAHDLVATSNEFLGAAWHAAAVGGASPVDLDQAAFVELEDARAVACKRGMGWWNVGSFGTGQLDDRNVTVAASDPPTFGGDVAAALNYLAECVHEGWDTIVTTEGAGSATRIVQRLGEESIPVRLVQDALHEPGVVQVMVTPPWPGYRAQTIKLAVLSERDITGRAGTSTRDMRKLPARRRASLDPLALAAGDYVVHDTHGVGRFIELTTRTAGKGGASREYLVIEYAPNKRGHAGDRLYVPTDQLHLVTKYTGGEKPSLNNLGGSDWAAAKSRARKAVRQIAGELIRLYSARMSASGRQFGPDTPWQAELEDAFAYVETPDQLATIDEVKADMEKSVPMDRLVSGDVGYGKTEIAVRAAFKAVQDGAQVVVLVPTTLLVQQHYQTFSERYAPFPVKVAALSRFQTDAEAKQVIAGLADGSIDVVIGTHRLLTGSIRFKDLGLVIVDEEQRFGVEHKETLKALRTNVDVLSMSATPIPRTLEMAITGIREMSTLATPPEERHPVLTFVGPAEDNQIATAIRRELLRDGQVFYVHNRVAGIEKVSKHLSELVPEARIAVAHGRMNEHQLEQVIVDFWERRFDVLVSTTIVETGLDIANANTLIVGHAERLGLSQLHQLRGRVGRGRERAYAYFLYRPDVPLSNLAHDRLATIAANTDLGSGMAVALKDLEIRGAGNLLGAEQSGHIEGVGFDMYVRMVGEAVAAFKGEGEPARTDARIELPIPARVPETYIGSERLRLDVYRKVAGAVNEADLGAVAAELLDRFGPIPLEVECLFDVARLRMDAVVAGFSDVTIQGNYVRFAGAQIPESVGLRLRRIYRGTVLKPATRTVLVPIPKSATIGGTLLGGLDLISWVKGVIGAFRSGANGQ